MDCIDLFFFVGAFTLGLLLIDGINLSSFLLGLVWLIDPFGWTVTMVLYCLTIIPF
jgi:hypothetical protein